jgi:formylglycine-generating enzyme required for sulfatase activity
MGVAQKKPNAFGLYDVAGNVWEMCQDHWHDHYHGAPQDASAWLEDDDPLQRVMRGGSFRVQSVAMLMCAFRSSAGVYYSGDDLGIRPVAAVEL